MGIGGRLEALGAEEIGEEAEQDLVGRLAAKDLVEKIVHERNIGEIRPGRSRAHEIDCSTGWLHGVSLPWAVQGGFPLSSGTENFRGARDW